MKKNKKLFKNKKNLIINKRFFLFWSFFCFLALALVDCSSRETDGRQTKKFIEAYVELAFKAYDDSYQSALKLKNAIETFINEPSDIKFQKAKLAWINARTAYGKTEVFRFYGGPIDNEKNIESFLNSWPLDEGHIDYISGNERSGIINDIKIALSKENLIRFNGNPGEKSVSLGYHAIEFLLWGQDLSEHKEAGKRAYSDYTKSKKNHQRRKQYLILATEILIDHLKEIVEAWKVDNGDNYRSQFLAFSNQKALKKILKGVSFLLYEELAGERMMVALESNDKENEQSCFSDQTKLDIINNLYGAKQVLKGLYGSKKLKANYISLLRRKNKKIAKQIEVSLQVAEKACKAIEDPFDQEIKGSNEEGKKRIMFASEKILSLGFLIASSAKELGIEINL